MLRRGVEWSGVEWARDGIGMVGWLLGRWPYEQRRRGEEERMQKEMGVVLLGREGGVSSIVYDRAGSNACMRLLANNKKRCSKQN